MRLSNGYQMARQHALPPGRQELRCVPDGDGLAPGQDLAGILLLRTEHDAAAEPGDDQGTCSRSGHSSSISWRAHGGPVFSWRMPTDDANGPAPVTKPPTGGTDWQATAVYVSRDS